MDLRVLLGPLYAAALGGLCLTVFVYGRAERLRAMPGRLWAWGALLALSVILWAWTAGVLPPGWFPSEALARASGLMLLVVSAALASRSVRLRRRAELMMSAAPRPIDEALSELRRGGTVGPGVYRGRLGAEVHVTSPGGVVCAFYLAQVREVAEDGGGGRLVSNEQACPHLLYVRGERREAVVPFAAAEIVAPLRVHRCRLSGGIDGAGEVAVGGPPVEALSFERVGKSGEPCVVVGRLVRGSAPGVHLVTGAFGAPATVVLGESALAPGRRLARRAWTLMGCAAALCAVSALLLARL